MGRYRPQTGVKNRFLFGAAPLLYGVAMLRSTEHRGWIAWIGVLFGLVGLAAAEIQVMSGASWLAFYVLFPIASIGDHAVDDLPRVLDVADGVEGHELIARHAGARNNERGVYEWNGCGGGI